MDAQVHTGGAALRVALELISSALLGAGLGLVSAFQSLQTVHGLWVGVAGSTLAAVALGIALAEGWSSVSAPLSAGVGWLLVVGYFAAGRPEGDVVVPGSAQGYAFLLLGLLGFAPGMWAALRRQRSSTTPGAVSGR